MRSGAASKLGPSDLGERVALLYRIDDEIHPYSEVAGVLQAIREEAEHPIYVVMRRNGSIQEVPEPKVISARVIRAKKAPLARLQP